MNKGEKDALSGAVFLALAIVICYGSVRLSLGDLNQPGPGFFSFLAGAFIGILSFIVILQSFKERNGATTKSFWEHPQQAKKTAYVLIALILYTVGMHYLGFVLSTFLFLGFLLRGIFPQPWRLVLIASSLATAVVYLIFTHWLLVPFPTGILGF